MLRGHHHLPPWQGWPLVAGLAGNIKTSPNTHYQGIEQGNEPYAYRDEDLTAKESRWSLSSTYGS